MHSLLWQGFLTPKYDRATSYFLKSTCHLVPIDMGIEPIFHYDAKPFVLGPRIGLETQRHNFTLAIPTCWYLKTLKFALPPTPTPNTCRWNIGGIGSPMQNSRVYNVDFMLFVSLSLALGSQHKHNFQWNMGLNTTAGHGSFPKLWPNTP